MLDAFENICDITPPTTVSNAELEVIPRLKNLTGNSEALSYLTSTLIYWYFDHLQNTVSTDFTI